MKEQMYLLEQFDDIKILRYDVPAFEGLSLREKLFVYYLSRAALAGRDILWDQNNKYNLRVRAALESILRAYQGNRETEEFQAFLVYAKKVFFANGVHHHYSDGKVYPLRLLLNILSHFFGKWERNSCTRKWNVLFLIRNIWRSGWYWTRGRIWCRRLPITIT